MKRKKRICWEERLDIVKNRNIVKEEWREI